MDRNIENLAIESEPELAMDLASAQPPVIDIPKRSSLAYLITALAGGNLLSSAFRMVGGLLQAHFVDKVTLGTFSSITLALNWSAYSQLGILNGLNRELPYYYGKGDHKRVSELASTARTWAVSLGLIVSCGFAGKAAWCAANGEKQLAVGWIAHSALVVMYFYTTLYLMATYRTAHDFARLSMANVAQNAAGVGLVVFVYWFGFNGICLRTVLSLLLGVTILHMWQPIRVPWGWNFENFRHLLKIGFPIFIVGEMATRLLFLIDNTLVNHYLSAAGLGLYYIVGVARDTAEIIPLAAGQVLYPRMTEYYGRTHDLPGILKMTIQPMIFLVLGMTPLVVLGWFLARPLTQLLLPKYIEAVPAMQWSLLIPLVVCLSATHNAYNICQQQRLYAVVILLSIAAYAGTLIFLCRHGAYLEAFPQALLVYRIFYVLLGYLFLIPLYWSWKKSNVLAAGEPAQ